MSIKSVPLDEIECRGREIVETVNTTGEPVVVTQQGEPQAVVLRYHEYQALLSKTGRESSRVERRPGVVGGEPVIRGTRIPVRRIVEYVKAGESTDGILEAFPPVTLGDIYGAMSYYYDNQAELDALTEASQVDRVLADFNLTLEKLGDGIAIVHDKNGRW